MHIGCLDADEIIALIVRAKQHFSLNCLIIAAFHMIIIEIHTDYIRSLRRTRITKTAPQDSESLTSFVY